MVSKVSRRILISAGELSGDMHAADLVRNILQVTPHIKFYGMGADLMQKAGVDIIVDAEPLSIIGGLGIIAKAVKIWRAFCTMKRAIWRDKPDLLILVDYPGFNLRLAKIAKKARVKVLYFISPKVWAWHESRVKTIKECVTLMAVIFPFEVDFYHRYQIPVKFVGNPLLQMIPLEQNIVESRNLLSIPQDCQVIGLFPGSRPSEIKHLLPIMLKAAEILYTKNPKLQFFLARATSLDPEMFVSYLRDSKVSVHIVAEKNYALIRACDAIIAASGTITLEIALMATPLVIIYKMAWLEYQIAKRLVKISYVGLCNILSQKKIVPELLQSNATPLKLAHAINKILTNDEYRDTMIENLKNVKTLLTSKEAVDLAEIVVDMCSARN